MEPSPLLIHIPRPYEPPRSAVVRRLQVTTEDAASIAVWEYGNPISRESTQPVGPAVLFLHGNGEEHGIFGPIIDAAVLAGYRCCAIDSRAQGKSSRGTERLTYERMAQDALLAMDTLGEERFHICGFSDGAILGFLLAAHVPERVVSLLAIGGNLWPEELTQEDLDAMQEISAAHHNWARFGTPGLLDKAGNPYPTPDQSAITAELIDLMLQEPHINPSELSCIVCPTTIMAGEFDAVRPEHTRLIAASIPGARLVIVPGAEHTLPKIFPDEVSRVLLETIRRA